MGLLFNASFAQGNDERGTVFYMDRLARDEPLINEVELGDEMG